MYIYFNVFYLNGEELKCFTNKYPFPDMQIGEKVSFECNDYMIENKSYAYCEDVEVTVNYEVSIIE